MKGCLLCKDYKSFKQFMIERVKKQQDKNDEVKNSSMNIRKDFASLYPLHLIERNNQWQKTSFRKAILLS
ncbi:hypothetical protein LMG33818_000034 [Halomonadaceae bacterium LMG 33818]